MLAWLDLRGQELEKSIYLVRLEHESRSIAWLDGGGSGPYLSPHCSCQMVGVHMFSPSCVLLLSCTGQCGMFNHVSKVWCGVPIKNYSVAKQNTGEWNIVQLVFILEYFNNKSICVFL